MEWVCSCFFFFGLIVFKEASFLFEPDLLELDFLDGRSEFLFFFLTVDVFLFFLMTVLVFFLSVMVYPLS